MAITNYVLMNLEYHPIIYKQFSIVNIDNWYAILNEIKIVDRKKHHISQNIFNEHKLLTGNEMT